MSDELVRRLNDKIGGIEVPAVMHGDNLSIVLCAAYEDADEDKDDETGWTPSATTGCDATLNAIRQHYAPLGARDDCGAAVRVERRGGGGMRRRGTIERVGLWAAHRVWTGDPLARLLTEAAILLLTVKAAYLRWRLGLPPRR